MDIQVGGAAIRADVASYVKEARRIGWSRLHRGEWFDAWMRPLLLQGAPGQGTSEAPEQCLRLAQARITAAAAGDLQGQEPDTIEDALAGYLEDVPDAFYTATGRAIFVAREQVLLMRDAMVRQGMLPSEDEVAACWEIMAAVAGVAPEDFLPENVAGEESPEALPTSPAAPFGLRQPALELARHVGARIVRHAVWQTAVAGVGRAVWSGAAVTAARQVRDLGAALRTAPGEMGTALAQARRERAMAARLVILGMWSMAVVDSSLHHSELSAIDRLCVALDVPGDWMRRLKSRSDLAADEFLNDLERLMPEEGRRMVHDAVVTAAFADEQLKPAELEYLQRISERLQEPFSEAELRTRLAAQQAPQDA